MGGGGGGVYSYIRVLHGRRISFEMNLISKEIRRPEHEYMNIHPPPPINALVTPLTMFGHMARGFLVTRMEMIVKKIGIVLKFQINMY